MLNRSGDRDCEGVSRRDVLRAGTLGIGGLTLSGLLSLRSEAAESAVFRDKSVVVLFLGGGPSHIETFDPKMDAPSGARSVTGEVRTSIPGVSFGGTFPRLAGRADRMAVVRSFKHRVGDHGRAIRHVLTAGDPDGTSMGSFHARLRGTNDPRTGMPTYAVITAPEVDRQYLKEKQRVLVGSRSGSLAAAYGPFNPSDGGQLARDLELHVPRQRFDRRRVLLDGLDRLKREVDSAGTVRSFDRFEEQAIDLILGGATEAFDLAKEDPRLVERYDTSRFAVGHKKKRPSVLGEQLLMARRLCERGTSFVTIQSAGWDMHADGNNPGIEAGMKTLGPPLDRAVSAFLEDLDARGMKDDVLLVITGDFGRTPKINKRGGRDHWANLCTLAFAGGGLKLGQAVGRSAPHADVPASAPVTPRHLLATILHVLFDVGKLRVARGVPREVLAVVERDEPIAELF